jgi:hypothetical protein
MPAAHQICQGATPANAVCAAPASTRSSAVPTATASSRRFDGFATPASQGRRFGRVALSAVVPRSLLFLSSCPRISLNSGLIRTASCRSPPLFCYSPNSFLEPNATSVLVCPSFADHPNDAEGRGRVVSDNEQCEARGTNWRKHKRTSGSLQAGLPASQRRADSHRLVAG